MLVYIRKHTNTTIRAVVTLIVTITASASDSALMKFGVTPGGGGATPTLGVVDMVTRMSINDRRMASVRTA